MPHSELIPRLAGCDYEQEVERVAPRLMAKEVEVQDAAILQQVWTPTDPEYAQDLGKICRQALEKRDISQDEDDDLFRAFLRRFIYPFAGETTADTRDLKSANQHVL